MVKPWLQLSILENMLQWEIYFLLLILAALSYGFYRFFLQAVNEERHRSLQRKFRVILKQILSLTLFFLVFNGVLVFKDNPIVFRILPYLGLLVLIAGCVLFINICRLFILQYFFLTSMKTAVPLLLVNIFTLMLSLFLAGWISTSLFGIQVAPLLATSAAFSIILGLALQDTLGNLFAGISLQLDHAFEIGNWVELFVGSQKVTGQVLEITWRSIILIGYGEEAIAIPNRIVAQSQILNWTRVDHPIVRSQAFRISYTEDIEKVKKVLQEAVAHLSVIKRRPAPVVFVAEMNDSWVLMKVAYYMDNFGLQHSTGDVVICACLKALNEAHIQIASPSLEVRQLSQNLVAQNNSETTAVSNNP